MSILIFLLVLSILVLVHELGHFIAAKRSGVLVEEFGIGFPPRLFGIKIKETIYSVNLIPLGGFVKLYGEEYDEISQKSKVKSKKLKNQAFAYKNPWQKILIIVAGVLGNFILGWFLISYLFTQGVPTPANKVIVEKVQDKSPAKIANLQPKDAIYALKVNQKIYPIKTSTDLITLTKKYGGEKIILYVERGKEKFQTTIIPRKNPPKNEGPLGIVITSFVEKKYPWYQAPYYGLIHAATITQKIISELIKTLIQIVSFQKPSVDVAGPIGIARFTSEVAKFGKNAVLELMALLSLNLAVVNLLPFPALDGGRLIFALYELITKKRINRKLESYLNLFGFIFLITVAILVSINDILKIYR
jgi:regulator of sigma E protease